METLRLLWGLFQATDPVFRQSGTLPTTEAADRGEYGQLSGLQLRKLKNRITELRFDLKINVLKQGIGDIEVLTEKAREGLIEATRKLLAVYENLVDDRIKVGGEAALTDAPMVTQSKVRHH
jgi:hypothetical protein